jgi:hypothetical protein
MLDAREAFAAAVVGSEVIVAGEALHTICKRDLFLCTGLKRCKPVLKVADH